MKYEVLWHEDSLKDLEKINKKEALKIVDKIENYLSIEPFSLGKPLKGHLKGFYRYRTGNYRVIYAIDKDKILILILKIGKRDIVYKNR